MLTFLDLKTRVRRDIWTAGEPRSRITAHDHMFVDALIEIQKYVECFQQNNTQLFPHCSTHYNCGLTSFDFGRGRINQVSVIDKIIANVSGESSTGVTLGDSASPMDGVTWTSFGGVSIAEAALTDALIKSANYRGFNTLDPAYQKFTFATRKIANSWSMVMGYAAYDTQPTTFTVQASNDGFNWTTLHTQEETDWSIGDTLTFTFANTGAYLHYRVTIAPTNLDHPLFNISITSCVILGDVTTTSTSYTNDYDWCSEVIYQQIDACHMREYLGKSAACGSCLPIDLFFNINSSCLGGKGAIPTPTDEGVPAGLPILPLGYHYPQESTDSTRRATQGVWAIERGRILIAPWIQSTETVVVRWNGIKRAWADGDLVEDDPDLIRAVKLYLQKECARDDDRDPQAEQGYERQFNLALQDLWHECRQETLVRECEPSFARGVSGSAAVLYYNDTRKVYTATCPSGQTGDPKTAVVDVGTVSSSISVSHANQLAQEAAIAQATALLVCSGGPGNEFWNTEQAYTAQCEREDGAPVPTGEPVTVIIPAHSYSSTISQSDADTKALNVAIAQATSGLSCVWHNRAASWTEHCDSGDPPTDPLVTDFVGSVPASDPRFDSTTSQSSADASALNEAKSLALELKESGCTSTPTVFYNIPQVAESFTSFQVYHPAVFGGSGYYFQCNNWSARVTASAGYCVGATQGEANFNARMAAQARADSLCAWAASKQWIRSDCPPNVVEILTR